MIALTRLNNQPLVVNADLVKFVEESPDTLITLLNGEKFMVRESAREVVERIVQFRREVLQGSPSWNEMAASRAQAAIAPGGQEPGSKPHAER